MIILIDTSPPNIIAINVSLLANFKSFSDFHFSLTKAACKKRLYGTTVVPTKAIMVKIPPSGIDGTNKPFINCQRLGWVNTAVIIKDKLIIRTKNINTFSKAL